MAFCLPRRRAIRRYCSPRRVSVLAAAITHWPSAPRRYGLPLPVRPGRAVFPGLEGARGQPGPRGGVPGGGEHRHVGAELGDDDPGVADADPGDLIEPCHQARHGRAVAGQPGEWPPPISPQPVQAGATPGMDASCCPILASRRVISSLIVSMSRRCVAISKAWTSRNRPVSAAASCLAGGLQPPVPERGQRRRAALPGDQGVQEPPAAGAEQVGDHHRDLQQRVLEDLLDPVLVPGLVLGQPGPGAGQRPQVPDCLRRHERAAQHPPLVQLAQPHAVFPVGFAPAGQVLDVPGVDQPHLQPAASAR